MGILRGRSLWAALAGSLLIGTVVVGSVVVGSLPASASTPVSLYVSTTGSDGGGTNTCTASATPCLTIQQANIEAATNYSAIDDVTINVAAGTYTEDDSVDASSLDSLTIAGAGASSTTVNGGGAGSVFNVFRGTVTISDLTVTNGTGLVGGGIVNFGTLTLNSSTVSDNSASGFGGGIDNDGTLTVNSSTVSGNKVTGISTFGGGIYAASGATTTINSSTVSGNTAGNFGGGIVNAAGTMTLNSSTVSGNSATGGGGIASTGPLTINSSTVSGNSATGDGGGIYNLSGTMTIGATIMANPGGNCYSTTVGSFTSLGYNLTNDASCGLSQPTDVTAAVVLGALGNNGGPTDTLLPPANSLAVGAIPTGTILNGVQVCPRSDQRGVSSFGNCTVGAVEGGFLIVAPSLPDATPGTAYGPIALTTQEAGVSSSPYTTTFQWTKVSAPKGLRLSDSGVLSGTPSKKLIPGSYSAVVQVTETVRTVQYARKSIARTTVQATIPLTIS